jgi:hypothetical protein
LEFVAGGVRQEGASTNVRLGGLFHPQISQLIFNVYEQLIVAGGRHARGGHSVSSKKKASIVAIVNSHWPATVPT